MRRFLAAAAFFLLPSLALATEPSGPDDRPLERAKALFDRLYADRCQTGSASPEAPQHHVLSFKYPYQDADEPPQEAHLFRFFCTRGAYNVTHAYLLENQRGELGPLTFATPALDIRYEDDANERVEDIRFTGYETVEMLVNSHFDPQAQEIVSHMRWRGLGDASSSGAWEFRSGGFTLVKYEVDASYDAEVNPQVLLDFRD
ncbi:DUF1176 domain-containing protein [Chelativorans sp. YIM 93263]|uniref:DUF1176 domain-containing protein n=1 Tax=Chelativorans sp. YIM 93263 TaxID=2906648 RepID=UPI0023792BB4|nr:DUF1176 domain-containing protein [Chelativorans sp. YIM 93263]